MVHVAGHSADYATLNALFGFDMFFVGQSKHTYNSKWRAINI